jgi:hypothetical protein
MPVEPSSERRRSREATYPLDAPRPKSPKPEADGKLDRDVMPFMRSWKMLIV